MAPDARPAPTVSVVTPFYNTAAYLAEAIESVLGQTYRDFEYVLVDNQSTDGSGEIARAWAEKDPRIKVIRNETFLDQDANFSHALAHVSATSRFTKLVLADDHLLPRCLEEMVGVAEAHPTVGLVSSYYLKGTKLMGSGWPFPERFMAGSELGRFQLVEGRFFFGSPTAVLFRSEVVRAHTPFYDSSVPHADTEACYRTLRDWDFGFVPQVLSFLRVEETSRMGSVRKFYPELLDKLIVVRKFGREFLDPDEHREVDRDIQDRYYRMICEGMLQGKGKAFREYHREGLATIGERLGVRELWRPMLLTLSDLALNPKRTLGRILER